MEPMRSALAATRFAATRAASFGPSIERFTGHSLLPPSRPLASVFGAPDEPWPDCSRGQIPLRGFRSGPRTGGVVTGRSS